MSRKSNAIPPLAEYVSVSPIYVDGLGAMKTIGAVTHLIFTTLQSDHCNGDRVERVIQARLIVPTDQLKEIGRMLLAGRILPAGTIDEAGEPVGIH
jgi:hypothetical protein